MANTKKETKENANKPTQAEIKKMQKEYETKIKELENKLKETEKPEVENKKTNKYKLIPDGTKVRIKSNIGGEFIFLEDRGKIRVFLQIKEFGQTSLISFDELKIFATSSPVSLNSGNIAIVDVHDDDIQLEDVITDLKLETLYFDKEKISPIEIETLFTDSVSDKDFEKKVNKSMQMADTIIEVANIKYREGLFNNNTKMNVLRQIYRNPNLFK